MKDYKGGCFMFGSQLVNEQATWEQIKAVLDVMDSGRWTSVFAYDHFIPPWHHTDEIMEHEFLNTLESPVQKRCQNELGNGWSAIPV